MHRDLFLKHRTDVFVLFWPILWLELWIACEWVRAEAIRRGTDCQALIEIDAFGFVTILMVSDPPAPRTVFDDLEDTARRVRLALIEVAPDVPECVIAPATPLITRPAPLPAILDSS